MSSDHCSEILHSPHSFFSFSTHITRDFRNITMFFSSSRKLEPKSVSSMQSGHILMIDGIALNKVCHNDANWNYIRGLCCEHFHTVNTYVLSLDTVYAVEKAVHKTKTCCNGKDGTIVAIGHHTNPEHYTAHPVKNSFGKAKTILPNPFC